MDRSNGSLYNFSINFKELTMKKNKLGNIIDKLILAFIERYSAFADCSNDRKRTEIRDHTFFAIDYLNNRKYSYWTVFELHYSAIKEPPPGIGKKGLLLIKDVEDNLVIVISGGHRNRSLYQKFKQEASAFRSDSGCVLAKKLKKDGIINIQSTLKSYKYYLLNSNRDLCHNSIQIVKHILPCFYPTQYHLKGAYSAIVSQYMNGKYQLEAEMQDDELFDDISYPHVTSGCHHIIPDLIPPV